MSQEQIETARRRRAEELSKSLRGAEAILRENGRFLRIRIREIATDDWGVRINVEALPTRGLVEPPTPPAYFSGAWTFLSVGSNSITATYCGWTVYYDRDLVADIVALAGTLRGDSDDYFKVGERINAWRECSTR